MKTLELVLNVKFSGRRECSKDDFFGFERLKVDIIIIHMDVVV